MTLFDDLLALVPAELHEHPGDIFYTGRAAFAEASPLYVLGLNPGGDPSELGFTVGHDVVRLGKSGQHDDWCGYLDESWRNGVYAAGEHPYQASILHMYSVCGLDPRRVPASNTIFVRTISAADLAHRTAELQAICWPVHERLINALDTKVVVCLGGAAGAWVRSQLGATALVDTYTETNRRGWRSSTHQAPSGIQVVTLTHPSRASWRNPQADPTELVRRALDRAVS